MRTSIFNFKKAAGGLACFFILALALEVAVQCFVHSRERVIREEKIGVSEAPGNSYQVVIFGDSNSLLGISSKIVADVSKHSVYNFSTIGWDLTFGADCLLRNYLRATKQRPEAVVLSFHPLNYQFANVNPRDFYFYADTCRDEFVEEFGWKHRWLAELPSLRQHFYLKSLIVNPFAGNFSGPAARAKAIDILRDEQGFYTGYLDQHFVSREDLESRHKLIAPLASSMAEKYLRRILELLQKENLRVYYVIPSTPYGAVSRHDAYISALLGEFKNVTVLRPQEKLLGSEYYADYLHLNRQGVEVLSKEIGQRLQADL